MSHLTLCYNTKIDALTRIESFAFSRIWRVGQHYYGISGSGIYKLDSPSDNSVESSIILCKTDFGTNALKRLSYLRMDADNDSLNPIEVGTKFEQAEAASVNINDFELAKRIKLGRGAKGRFVAVSIKSKSPVFSLRSFELYPQVVQRGVD